MVKNGTRTEPPRTWLIQLDPLEDVPFLLAGLTQTDAVVLEYSPEPLK